MGLITRVFPVYLEVYKSSCCDSFIAY